MSDGPRIRAPRGPLRLEGRTGGPVVLSSPRATAAGNELGGWTRVVAGPTVLVDHLTTSLPDPDTLTRTPFLSERAWSNLGIEERVLVPPNVDGFVAEWALGEGRAAITLDLAWSVPGGLSWKLGPSRLAVRGAGGTRRLFCLEPADRWEVERDPSRPDGLRVKARVVLPPGRAARLTAILRTDAARRRPVLRALGHLEAEQTRAEASLERSRREGLTLEVPDGRLDQTGLGWACARMASAAPTRVTPTEGTAHDVGALLAGMGFLAVGRFEAARELVPRAPAVLDPVLGDWEGSGDTDHPGAPTGIDGLLRAARASAEPVKLTRPGGLTGASPGDPGGGEPLAVWLQGWRAFDSGDPEAGYAAWLALLEHGMRTGWSWSGDDGPAVDSVLAGLVPATLVFGMLGARAEAAVGRLRLAPAFPARWRSARVANLRVGRSTVSVSYERSGASHLFSLEQTTGPIPVNLVFEPLVPGTALVGAEVDDEPAELDEVSTGRRVGVRLQLPLDRERRLRVRAHG